MKSIPPPATRNPTLLDVARDAGVARTTVAEILRGKAGYNDQTRKLVTAAAKRLGYRPNQLGKALRRGKSMTIGIVTPTIDTPAQMVKLEGAEAAARAAGYLTYMVGWGDPFDPAAMKRCVHDLIDRCVDGVIFFDNLEPPPQVLEALRDAPMPVVYIDWVPPGETHAIRQDRRRAASDLADHLVSLGHRRAALMSTPWTRAHPSSKLNDILNACTAVGIEVDSSERWLIDIGGQSDKGLFVNAAYETVARALTNGDLPTALIANNDDGAIAAIGALSDAGMQVPRDISVVGYNDDPHAAVVRPALTTIHQPRTGVGAAAFAMLHTLMKNPRAEVTSPVFTYELIVRDSTGPAPQR